MSVLYRKAIEAAIHPATADWLTEAHVADLDGLTEALNRLNPEQRCDAIYLDWLLQLNSPSLLALLQIRNLIIDRGALAANYLAELAQNANDAYDEEPEGDKGAQVRIVLDGEWLFVSNNGRKITPLNLLGLSRFFVHAGGEIVPLNEQTIGRFGIGFKSCYRIASSVVVHTWDKAGEFGFRLPICREADENSHFDGGRLDLLIGKLKAVGEAELDPKLRNLNRLGYCTPEYSAELPKDLAEKTKHIRESRGTLFCFRIRPDKLDEVQGRISGQAHEIYELCPLFLPKVRLVQLGKHVLRMKEKRPDLNDSLAGQLTALKVELTTESEGEKTSNSRFWRLQSIDGTWQIALHADSQFRLKVEQEDDEHGTTIKDGAAYAFFPLNAVTKNWPFRLHLHIQLPTNLARDDWNPDESAQVQQTIQRAVVSTAAWLEQHTQKWHPYWRIESLVARKPNQNENWAWLVWNCLCQERSQRNLVRTVDGGFSPATGTKAICLVERDEVFAAWKKVLELQPISKDQPRLAPCKSEDFFPVTEVVAKEVAELCQAALSGSGEEGERHMVATKAFFGVNNLMFHRIPEVVLDFLPSISCQTSAGSHIPLSELCQQPSGAELIAEWHHAIKTIESWSNGISWEAVPVGGKGLAKQFWKLSKPEFNPTWTDLPSQLTSEEQWKTYGDRFWNTPRSQCPVAARPSALSFIRVPSKYSEWLPIANLWLDDDSNTECFGGLLAKWDRPWSDVRRKNITVDLKDWGLWEPWEQSTKKLLKDNLPGVLARRLADHREGDAFGIVFDAAFETSRRHLDDAWKHIIEEAIKSAVSRLIAAQTGELNLSGKSLIGRSVSESIRAALGLLPEYVTAPAWLTDAAYLRIKKFGLEPNCQFKFFGKSEVENNQEQFARELLEKFYVWQEIAIKPLAMLGLWELAAATSLTKRREWVLKLGPQQPRQLRALIVPTSLKLQTTAASRLEASLLKRAKWDGEGLPACLIDVLPVAEACIQPNKLVMDTITDTLSPLESEQLPDEITALSDFKEVVDSGNYQLLGSPKELNLRWRHEGDIVARLDDAEFVIEADRIIVHRFRPPADEEQCRRVLGIFETNTTVSPGYTADAVLSPFERYQKHRETIRQTLLKELVARVGYEKHHILRELLQNAESAYASKSQPPPDAWFEFCIVAATVAGHRKVVARHAGRAFDEIDVMGQKRQDVERIWKLASANERTADEVGRFNRGFKTLFTVAANGTVHIRSGDFDFEVIDLLMLKPANPQPNPSKHSPLSEFSFEVSYQQALDMFRLESSPNLNTVLRIVSAATFVFLSHIKRIHVGFELHSWQWRIERTEDALGWKNVSIFKEGTAIPERFIVFSGLSSPSSPNETPRRFAAAVRLDGNKLPIPLEKGWHKFHLTFETEHDFPLDFIINGDFDADQGRVGLRNISRSGLVELAYDAVIQRAEYEIRRNPTVPVWLAWARILHLKDASTEFIGDLHPLHRHAEKASERLCTLIPHAGALIAASTLEFPSLLLRRLVSVFGQLWKIDTRLWIDLNIAAVLPEGTNDHGRINFPDWVVKHQPNSAVLQLVDGNLKSEKFAQQRLSGPEKDELDRAKIILAEKLRPIIIIQPPEPEIPLIEAWSVENLWHWWERQNKPMSNYTLEGNSNWGLLYSNDNSDTNGRQARLKWDLLSAASAEPSPQGLSIWYRLFGLACLMSAGRRMSEIHTFWQTELDGNQFWERTSAIKFSQGTDALFADVTTRPFTNLTASGENAYFWRRVFYDIRKIHRLVWEDQFPATLMALVQDGRSGDLIHFLKTGYLPDQRPWVGVFGQSAGVPLFFIVRELCRLGLIPSNPEVRRFAFFVSTPVRRAMERIGWLNPDATNRADFESLALLSDALYQRIAADTIYGPRLLPYYDIPLLHLGLEG